jgi:hypothetical protein
MNFANFFKRPSAFLPIVMSVAALATLGIYVAFNGTAPQPDEVPAARIWQLLMVGQIPIIAYFALRWIWKAPKPVLAILAIQAAAFLAALAPVYLLGF